MSPIRDKARAILDAALPEGLIVTSNGATAAKFTELTRGLTHKRLTEAWAKGSQLTGCNEFTGWFGAQLGAPVNLGGFDLHGIVAKAGKPEAWIPASDDALPDYGDILRHKSFHVDVALDFEGPLLWRAAGGQGGKKVGYDAVKRVRGTQPYQPSNLIGWIDIDILLGGAPGRPAAPGPWFEGWWQVWDGSFYFYYFAPRGEVTYVKSKPKSLGGPPAKPANRGRYRYEPGRNTIIVDWDSEDGGSTRETFYNAVLGARTMNAESNRYSPLIATRM